MKLVSTWPLRSPSATNTPDPWLSQNKGISTPTWSGSLTHLATNCGPHPPSHSRSWQPDYRRDTSLELVQEHNAHTPKHIHPRTYAHTPKHIYPRTYAHTPKHMHTRIYTYIYIRSWVYSRTPMSACTYTFTHTYTRTHASTYTFTYANDTHIHPRSHVRGPWAKAQTNTH